MKLVDEGGTRRASTHDDDSEAMRRKPRRRPNPPPSNGWGRFKRWAGFEKKTPWDWLELLVVPLMLALVGVGFAWLQAASQNAIEDRRVENERRVQDQRAQDAALQAYLDQMSTLIIDKNLRKTEKDSEERLLARARTVTILKQLVADPRDIETNKEEVVEFLIEATLVHSKEGETPVISLRETDLTGMDLDQEDLHGAILSRADLQNANLAGTNLEDADLEEAVLRDTNLEGADLSRANLTRARGISVEELQQQGASLEGATMPDGSKHP
jgi:uncharacterized protein YjbI with pentapeptide repeats